MKKAPILNDEGIKRDYLGTDYHPSFKLPLEIKHSLDRVAQSQRDADHRYYLEQFVRWLKKRHIWAEGIVLIPLKEADWQALLKESEGGK